MLRFTPCIRHLPPQFPSSGQVNTGIGAPKICEPHTGTIIMYDSLKYGISNGEICYIFKDSVHYIIGVRDGLTYLLQAI